MSRLPCPLCKTIDKDPAPVVEIGYSVEKSNVKCSRCGDFYIGADLTTPDRQPSEDRLLRLSYYARTETDAGRNAVLTRANYEEIARRVPVPTKYGEYFDRVLARIAVACRHPGNDMTPVHMLGFAADAFLPGRSYDAVTKQLQAAGLLEVLSAEPTRFAARPTLAGWQHVDRIAAPQKAQGQRAVVAMWVDLSMVAPYAAVEAALTVCGFERPFRTDDFKADRAGDPDYGNKIDERVVSTLRQARFLLADVTAHRQSVYFQAGFAEGLGVPVIWSCRKDAEPYIAIDPRPSDLIAWGTPEELRAGLEGRLRKQGLTRG